MPTDPRIRRLRALTRQLATSAGRQARLAGERRGYVNELLRDDDWSLQRIADALGVSKSAVQRMRGS